ncbi:hypothetical protein TrCOL_g7988 [Triparma columacea]|uniref:Uncharacterized protein n=1 Tax=Triparma columacea TaxID=722753 RepID=A0A9W7LFI6_9STRA|nr:hypothetical protein TrCOL_g7988 [Triparma columacea]
MEDDGWGDLFAMAAGGDGGAETRAQGAQGVPRENEKMGVKKKKKKRKKHGEDNRGLVILGDIARELVELRWAIYEVIVTDEGRKEMVNGKIDSRIERIKGMGSSREIKQIPKTANIARDDLERLQESIRGLGGVGGGWERGVENLCRADECYFRMYYMAAVGGRGERRGELKGGEGRWALKTPFDIEMPNVAMRADVGKHPLEGICERRREEVLEIFKGGRGWEGGAVGAEEENGRDRGFNYAEMTPLAPKALHRYRQVSREWPCHIYGYACLDAKQIEWIKDIAGGGKAVEGGAGTGYLAKLIGGVQAFDLRGFNEYHGQMPPWVKIFHIGGGSGDDVRGGGRDCLLLSYPPPGTPMAEEWLKMKKWETVVYIGEWVGLTGTQGFERKLVKAYSCLRREWCMDWGDDVATVTVWRRKREGGEGREGDVIVQPCVGCEAKAAKIRNVYSRREEYCTRTCAERDGEKERRRIRMEGIGVFVDEGVGGGEEQWICIEDLRKR